MNKELPCYIVSDLLPLYQDDILSEQTKKDIDKHLSECEDCKKRMDAMKMKIDIQPANTELKTDPLKKVRFYQKALTALGAAIAFILGTCVPIAVLALAVLERGEITTYQITRVKHFWYGSVKNFVALVKNGSFLVRITDMTILIEKEFIYGSSKRPNPTDYYRKQHYQCG